MRKAPNYNTLTVTDESGNILTYNEVSALALEAKDLKAMARLLTYGMVRIGEQAYFLN